MTERITTEQLQEAMRSQFGAEVPEDREAFDRWILELWSRLPASEQEKADMERRSQSARENDTPDGYADFFWCCTRLELPKHALYGWIVPIYLSHREITLQQFKAYFDRPEAVKFRFIRQYVLGQLESGVKLEMVIGAVIEASRELIKTTAITNYFTAFRIGQQPHRANLLIQVGDAIAKDNSSQVARVIKEFAGWKKCFPHVVPDEAKGWGDNGYEVKQTHKWEDGRMVALTDDEWNKLIATRKDPTLLGVGYNSSSLIGKHPNGICVIDDIHDENNTASEKELDGVLNIVESVINYTFTSDAWVVYVGTPWAEHDTLGYIKSTGAYLSVKMPNYVEIVNGEPVLPDEWREDTVKVFLWPEERGEDWVRKKLSQTRKMSEFLRMILLTLKAAGDKIYKYFSYPHKDIKWYEWEIVIGLDPTATFSTVSGKGAGVSHFAMCYALKTPWNTIILGGGYLEKVGVDVGERELMGFIRRNPTFSRASVEDDGAGAVFIGFVSRNSGLRINNHSAIELSKKHTKKERQFDFLSPYLSAGTVLISDEDTPYLNALRKYFDRYPQIDDRSETLDAADAACYAVLDIPEVWANTIMNVLDPNKLKRRDLQGRDIPDLGTYRFQSGGR
jgi:hypothetical protein